MLYDPYSGNYFRVSEAYYKFLTTLSFERTVEQAWVKALEEDPENGPGQQDVINLLVELNTAGLIYFENAKDSQSLYEKGMEKKKIQRKNMFSNILFMRFPVWNPDRWLKRFLPLWRVIFGKLGGFVWLITILYGIKLGAENSGMFAQQAKSVLDPDNVILLYLCVAFIKICHEIGHGAVCVKYGGYINTIGVMLLIFTPLPYIDATASWAFRNKWERIYVSSAGMLVEVFLGAIACMVWVNAPPGLIQVISYNLMFTATVSTVLFNANPLIRYDGYYILADFIEIPNLSQKSTHFIYAVFQKYVFGIKEKDLNIYTVKEGVYLAAYGVASFVYRLFLFTVIALFVADKYFFVGVCLAVSLTFVWIYTPVKKYFNFLISSKELHGIRPRVIRLNFYVFLLAAYFAVSVPVPYSFTLPGVVKCVDSVDVLVRMDGRVKEVKALHGERVKKGDVLMVLENRVLEYEIAQAGYQMKQISVAWNQNMLTGSIEGKPIHKRKEAIERYLAQLLERKKNLIIRAPVDGYWIYPEQRSLRGQYIAKGRGAGSIINNGRIRFISVAGQEKSSELFGDNIEQVTVRLTGKEDTSLNLKAYKVLPHASDILPAKALGWKGGGEIPVVPEDPDGLKTIEPFYLVYGDIITPGDSSIYQGQTGKLNVEMKPVPTLNRILTIIKQFLQERYQV
ncbi:biotin/lipoyl-binding protein [uncultured Desulfobacter sp.]|uniref:biotin/lipoyl-binding protein n=1 Tax=uncultured Desulfobacter sp. TaxID=240139 RepID=UPI0029F5C83E|nr:biotin/lipoyl-binding protein [uncultured Desulfobacter sp.]